MAKGRPILGEEKRLRLSTTIPAPLKRWLDSLPGPSSVHVIAALEAYKEKFEKRDEE